MTTHRARLLYFGAAVVTALLGLASRRLGPILPAFVATYAGDTLWALALFWLLGAAWPRASARTRGAAALLVSCAVEVSQLYHAPWLDAIRSTQVGGLVLGFGFLWSDLVCYTVGVIAGVVVDQWATRRRAALAASGRRAV